MAERNNRKMRTGVVVSNKMDKSVVVRVQRQMVHPKYGRTVRRNRRLAAHDENNECNIGDIVRLAETRPLSRTKRWRVSGVVSKAK